MSIHCRNQIANTTTTNWCSSHVLKTLCCLGMHPKVGSTVYHIPELLVVKSEMQAGVLLLQVEYSKARKVAVAVTLNLLSLFQRIIMKESDLATIQERNIALMNERNSLVYGIGAPQQEVSSFWRKGEVTMGSCSFGRTRRISDNSCSNNRGK